MSSRLLALTATVVAGALAGGCGSSSGRSPVAETAAPAAAPTQPTTSAPAAGGTAGEGGVAAAASGLAGAGAGDPVKAENDIFVRVRSESGGYSLRVPGWWRLSEDGSSLRVVRRDDVIAVRVARTPRPTTLMVLRTMLRKQHRAGEIRLEARPRLTFRHRRGPVAYRSVMTTTTSVSRTTGAEMELRILRYDFVRGRTRATLTMQTPVGVSNRDAYALMARSFRWQR